MLWHAMPPELNTALLMAGAGPAPMMQAAAGWEALGAALETQAAELAASLAALNAAWTGISSERAIAAATPMVAWLEGAAKQAQQRGMQAAAQAAAYMQALGTTPSLPEIASNHISHTVLSSTNFLGINMVPIGLNETDYFVRMWTQAGTSMDVYQAETMANTTFEPPEPIKPILQPTIGEAVEAEAMSRISEMAAESSGSPMRTLAALADDIPDPTPDPSVTPFDQLMQFLGGMGQLSGPMQQLMQPLQQLTSMMGQGGGLGSTTSLGDTLASSTTHEIPDALGQMGLLGASPFSSHPLAGGLGPSVGMGLMQAEGVPGAGGTAARTSLMSQLIDKPGVAVAPAGAGAGSSAMGGAAPMGAGGMGAGAQSGPGPRPGLVAPGLPAQEQDDSPHEDVDDGDDW